MEFAQTTLPISSFHHGTKFLGDEIVDNISPPTARQSHAHSSRQWQSLVWGWGKLSVLAVKNLNID
jgi:hypothetical protein